MFSKNWKVAVLMVVSLILFTTAGFAEETERLGIGMGMGYINPEEGFDPAVLSTVNLTYGVNTNFSIELSVGGTLMKGRTIEKVLAVNEDGEVVEEETELYPDITIIPVQVTMQPRFHFGNLSPYIGAGIGYYFTRAELSDDLKGVVKEMRIVDPTFDISVKAGNAYGLHTAVGTDYFLSKNLAIGVDAKYLWAWGFVTTEVTIDGVKESTKDKLKLNSSVISIGAKYLF